MDFPPHLAERWCRRDGQPRDGEYVVYWMRTAVRGHENPALDAAIGLAESLGLPLWVYHAVSERYPFANDRHHTFILQGARDVAAELASRSIPYALHIEREGHRGPHLKTIGDRASVLVTEEMPVSPIREWTERLAAAIEAPVWTFDTACVVPVTLPGKPFTRAFKYRDAVKSYRRERLQQDWEERSVPVGWTLPELPFEPVNLADRSIRELVAACAIDHSVAPVRHTRGGSVAGYERWERFKERGLTRYGKTRNDPLKDGASRMSAYLHYGQVSPFRLARESKAKKADKYLDELVTWRELAYTYCYYESDLDTDEALPAWARETLRACERDPRPALLSWETLARAATGDPLWDACQDSLLIHGELHNNVRMTWGKKFLEWTPNVSRALTLCLDLNHRYALDGRDPSSYGGILWCFGQLDRPFSPAKPIFGTVRPRPTEAHAKRLDVRAYHAKTGRPIAHHPPRVAMVGAGIAGMFCARTLKDHGVPVTVFDKGRGPGGRMSTRRQESHQFDHGAQYFVARDRDFRRYVLSWLEDEVVGRWEGKSGVWSAGEVALDDAPKERFVGTPSMSAVVSHLGRDLETRFGAAVTATERRD
ncbi:MAG: NAD(P)-binding protein, partial [Myxococcota bacterium]